MSVGDSAEEFVLIRSLGRERLPVFVVWTFVQSAQIPIFRPLGHDTYFVPFLHTPAANCGCTRRREKKTEIHILY